MCIRDRTGADVNLAYPQAEIAVMGAEGAVNILYRKASTEEKKDIIEQYKEKFSNPYRAAERGFIDEIIMPRDTRYKLVQALEMAHNKNQSCLLYTSKHLEDREVRDKLRFLLDYCDASNPATGSKYDANANVENKNVATLIGELPKANFIRLNRRLLTERLKDMYGKEISDRYIELLNNHFIYKNDETSLANYCASITMYPWLISGTMSIGGNSTAPTNLKSFCGGFINMVFIVSSMLSGACATPEFLMYMNYFVGKEFGKDYYKHADKVVDLSTKPVSYTHLIFNR